MGVSPFCAGFAWDVPGCEREGVPLVAEMHELRKRRRLCTHLVWGKGPVWDVPNRPYTIYFDDELGFCEPRTERCGK